MAEENKTTCYNRLHKHSAGTCRGSQVARLAREPMPIRQQEPQQDPRLLSNSSSTPGHDVGSSQGEAEAERQVPPPLMAALYKGGHHPPKGTGPKCLPHSPGAQSSSARDTSWEGRDRASTGSPGAGRRICRGGECREPGACIKLPWDSRDHPEFTAFQDQLTHTVHTHWAEHRQLHHCTAPTPPPLLQQLPQTPSAGWGSSREGGSGHCRLQRCVCM